MHASARSDDDDASQAARAAFHHWTLWQAMSDWLGDLLLHPRAHTDFPSDMDACADTLIRLTDEEPDVAIFHMVHARIDKVNRYSVLHAMHCAMLLTLIGRHRKWDEARTATAVKAGLTMNLSITALQNQLAQQTTPLTRVQHDAIEAHPAASTQMLRELGVRDEAWL